MSIEQSGTGDLIMQFSDGLTTLDTTPAATIELTAGTDTTPTENFIYIPQSTKVLTKSTSDWPSAEHIKVGYFLVPSASFVQTNGTYINQNWNDHMSGTDKQGHLLHIAERSRRDGAYYFSGIDPNGTSSYLTISGTNVDLKSTSGVIYKMHKHTYPAVDTSTGDVILVKNWNGDSYHNITNLFDIVADSTGAGITNKWINIVIWGVANKTGEYEPMLINLPSGSYSTQSNAESDVDGFDDFTIPREFGLESSTGFLIARITVRVTASTWTFGSVVDLRGQSPVTASGGASAITTDFADNQFTIFDEVDTTKIMDFDVGTSITTGNTRTITMADQNINLGTDFIFTDGTSTTTADIPFALGLTSQFASGTSTIIVKSPDSARDITFSCSNSSNQVSTTGSLEYRPSTGIVFYDTPSVDNLFKLRNSVGTDNLVISADATITSASGTIGFDNENITTTGLLTSAGANFGANYVDWTEMATPANPSANVARMYSRDDTGTTKLFFRDSAGTETELGGGGGGGGTPGGSDTQIQYNNASSFGGITNFTFDGTNITVGGTAGNTKMLFRSSSNFIHSNAVGELTIEASSKVTIGVAGDIVLGDATERDMYPQTTLKINLGTAANQINDIHMGGEFHITRESASLQPTPAVGELKIWRDPDDNKTYLIYNDTNEGVRKVELT